MRFKPKTKLRILVLLSQELMPPETIPEGVEREKQLWRTEYDVISTLKSMEHDVYPVGLRSDLAVIANAREEHKPQIAFNLLEDFEGQALFDQHVDSCQRDSRCQRSLVTRNGRLCACHMPDSYSRTAHWSTPTLAA